MPINLTLIKSFQMECPICKGQLWKRDKICEKVLGLIEPYNLYKCLGCNLKAIKPYLTEEELRNFYSAGYYKPTKNNLKNSNYEVRSSDYKESLDKRRNKFISTIDSLQNLLPNAKTFLDVGAATGLMVKIASDKGLKSEGIEKSKYAIKEAKKTYNIDLKNINLKSIKSNNYDIVHLNHVFEHFNNPRVELFELNRIINNDGLIYIEVPFQLHFIEKIKAILNISKKSFDMHSIHHPFFYSKKNITNLLVQFNFEILYLSIYDSSRIQAKTKIQKFKKIMWKLLSILGIGNYIEVIAKKKA